MNKLNVNILFSPFLSNIKNIDAKITYTFTNTVFKNECSQFKNNVLQ